MTPVPRYDFRIAADYNQPLGSLVNIETIADADGVYFYPPVSYGEYDPGAYRVRGNGVVTTAGFGTTKWRWTGSPQGRLTPDQDVKLSADYCGGGRSGTVTIYTPLAERGVYERCNAVMILPKLPSAGRNFDNLGTYEVLFTRLVTL